MSKTMYQSKLVGGMADNRLDSRFFLFEILMGGQNRQAKGEFPIRRSGPQLLKVPYNLMNQEIRRINQMGGKILSIKPLTTDINDVIGVDNIGVAEEVKTISQLETVGETETVTASETLGETETVIIPESPGVTEIVTPSDTLGEKETISPSETVEERETVTPSETLAETNPPILSMENHDLPWWVEIYTSQPRCLYYFGPFDSASEANYYKSDYIEDLQSEGAEGITAIIKQCQPTILTQEW